MKERNDVRLSDYFELPNAGDWIVVEADLEDIGGTSGSGTLTASSKPWWSARFVRCAADAVGDGFFAELEVRGLSQNTVIGTAGPSKT